MSGILLEPNMTHDDKYLTLSGGTLTGPLVITGSDSGDYGVTTTKYIKGSRLQTTGAGNLNSAATKIAVLDDSGWIYYRTPAQILSDIGVNDAIQTAIGDAMGGSY